MSHATIPRNDTLARALARPRTSIDADVVNYRLAEAGETLLALPKGDWSLRLDTASLEIVRTALEVYGWTSEHRIKPALPSMAKIARMDEALDWVTLISPERAVLRRVVGARALVHPITDQTPVLLAAFGQRARHRPKGDPAVARPGYRPDRKGIAIMNRCRIRGPPGAIHQVEIELNQDNLDFER